MKKQLVNNSSQDTIELMNTTVGKTFLVINAVNDTNNTDNTDTSINLKNIRISLSLTQGGKTISSSFNAVGPAALAASMGSQGTVSDLGFASTGTTATGVQTRAKGVSNPQETALVIPITLTPYQLKGNDKLCIDIDLVDGHFGADADSSSKVYFYTSDENNSNSFDMVLPHYRPIQDDKQDDSFTIPMASQIAILDTAATSYDSEALAVSNIAIDSRHYDDKFEEHKFVGESLLKHGSLDGLATGNNFMLLDTFPATIDGCKVDLSINTANVTSGAQFVYYLGHQASTVVAKRGQNRIEKIAKKKLQVRGLA